MRRIHYNTLVIISLLFLVLCPAGAQTAMQELGDSLTAYTGFSPLWSSPVKVKNLRVNRNNITVKTNAAFKDVRWTPDKIRDIKRKVSYWVLGNGNGKVTIIAGRTNIEDLVTDCAKSRGGSAKCPTGKCSDLTDRNIALYPSHGLYFNRARNEWIWQRATLWTTVEDLYTREYTRLLRRMLENAGADIYTPRAGLEQQDLGLSGMPRWTEGARYWLMANGVDSTLWDLYEGDEYKDDMKCRAMWINSLDVPIDLCLAFHTDGVDSGDDSTIVGTLVIYTARDDDNKTRLRNGRDREKVNRNLADWIQTQVTEDLRHWDPGWTRRQLREANYCETRVPVVPSVILELLSHKNMADMKYGLDPKFRFAAARAVYKGILRYINGQNAIVQPLPVEQLGIGTDGVLRWQAHPDPLEPDAMPTYYLVYVQENDGEWDVQQVERATQVKIETKPGVKYNYYVVAGNDGGLSFPSPVISSYRHDGTADEPVVLIVDGFDDTYGPEWFADSTYAGIKPDSYACEDGFTCAYIGQQWDFLRASEWINDDNCGWGSCYRDHAGQLTVGNTHDWSARHGRVLRRMKTGYVSCTAGMLSAFTVQPSEFGMIDFVCGRNRVPMNDACAELISTYLDAGGRLLLSTDHMSAMDPAWVKRCLHASYYAARSTRSGRITSPRHRLYQLMLEPNEEQLFTCMPEALMPTDTTAVRMATYEDMRCPAAVGYEHRSLVYGFPLEAVMDFDKIYRHAVEWLLQ